MKDPTPLRQLAWFIADPDQVTNLPQEDIPELLGALEALKARFWSRLLAPSLPRGGMKPPEESDRFLTAQEAADRIGVKPKWMYSHADSLPFTRRLEKGTLRFSERGLTRWMESRKAS